MLKRFSWPIIFSTFLLTLVLFHSSLYYYFFQDDWFLLDWVNNHSFPSFFQFRTDIIYWRPLSMPVWFFTLNKLFSLNSFAFHIASFTIFFALVISVYKLLLLLIKNQKSAIIGTFLYATWSVHYMSLSWLSTTSYIIGPLLQTLCFSTLILFSKSKKKLYYFTSFLLFIIALTASEFTLVLPLIILIYFQIESKKLPIKELFPFFVTIGAYVFLRFVLFPVPAEGDYKIKIDLQVINNYVWYLLWSFNLPESFKTLIFPNMLQKSAQVLTQFWQISTASTIFAITMLLGAKSAFKNNSKSIFLGVAWFVIGLLPVIFLTDHSYPIYLSFAGIGLVLIFAIVLQEAKSFLTVFLLIVWFGASYFSTQFTKNTHWIRNEQAVSKAYTQYVLTKIPNPSHNAAFIFRPANTDFSKKNQFALADGVETIKLSLNYDSAMKVLYKDQSLRSVFLTYKQNIDLPPEMPIYDIDPLE